MTGVVRCCLVVLISALVGVLTHRPAAVRHGSSTLSYCPSLAAGPTDPVLDQFAGDHREVRALRAIAVDIDRDGDLDVVALMPDVRIVVWLNDGFGHFTREERSASFMLASDRTVARAQGADSAPGSLEATKWWVVAARRDSPVAPAPVASAFVPMAILHASRAIASDRPTRAPPASVRFL